MNDKVKVFLLVGRAQFPYHVTSFIWRAGDVHLSSIGSQEMSNPFASMMNMGMMVCVSRV